MKNFKFILLFAFLMQISMQDSQAQKEIIAKTTDIIYMKDGRVLKGEIIIFQETDGDLTFKDDEGRTYSITRKEYRYFKQDVAFVYNEEKLIVLKKRRENQMEINVGITPMDILASNNADFKVNPIVFYGGVSKYFNRRHQVGLGVDYGLFTDKLTLLLRPSVKYSYAYDAYKRNVYPTLIAQIGASFYDGDFESEVRGSQGSYTGIKQTFNTFNFGIGHGVTFMVADKKSISLELLVSRGITFGNQYKNDNDLIQYIPNSDRTFSNFALRCLFNL